MPTPIRVLIVEDSEPDARLMVRELHRAGYAPSWERVETSEAMRAALERQAWDVVLSDYKMPHFSGPAALILLREIGLDLPFIVVSGTIGEENAVAMMTAGAHDYVLKENLTRLAPAIAREIREAEVRCARRQTEAALQESEARLRAVLATLPVGVFILNAEGHIVETNAMVHRIWGGAVPLSANIAEYREYHGWWADTGKPLRPDEWAAARAITNGETSMGEIIDIERFDGTRGTIINTAAPLRDAEGQISGAVVAIQDISELRQAQQALEKERSFYRLVIDTVPNFVGVKDGESRFVLANKALGEVYGVTPDALLGKSDADYNPNAEEVAWFHRDDQDVIRTRAMKYIPEERVTDSTGRVRWLETVKVPLINADGSCTSLLLATTDITMRKHAEDALKTSLEQYRSLFTVEPDALLLIDVQTMQVLDVNEAAVCLYGYVREHLLTMKATDLSAEPEQTRDIIQEAAIGQLIRVSLRYHRKADGAVFPIEATGRTFVLGDRPVMFAAIRDISDRLHAEKEMKRERAYLATAIELLPFPIIFLNQERQVFRANQASAVMLSTRDHEQRLDFPLLLPETHLEIPLEQRPAARALRGEIVTAFEGILRIASDQELPVLIYAAPITVGSDLVAAVIAIQDITALKEADRAKNQFLNVISHEMRTPLTAILGWAQLAEDDPTLSADALHAIHQSAQAQHGVLERLILLSRILTGKLTLQRQPADLWVLADQVATANQLCAQERQVTLRCNPPAEPLPVSIDPKLMRQALQEMLDNALKYTAAGGHMTVSATRMQDQAVVAVHDTGQGIALEDLSKLWKPFQQVVREESLGGLGIGLVLLRGIVEAHGGQVFVVSPGVGKGSTFSISIALVLPLPGPPDTGANGDSG